jgi:hypothetical protein
MWALFSHVAVTLLRQQSWEIGANRCCVNLHLTYSPVERNTLLPFDVQPS